MNYPECFQSENQFMEWRGLAIKSNLKSRASVCVDCTPEYKTQMLSEDRCAEPEVYFNIVSPPTSPYRKNLPGIHRLEDIGEMVGDFPEDRLRAMKNGSHPWGKGREFLSLKMPMQDDQQSAQMKAQLGAQMPQKRSI